MKRQLSDEQLDSLLRTLVNEASADNATVDEIADSPTVWWGVQRQINAQKAGVRSAWPPPRKVWRWLMIGVPMATAAAVLTVLFAFQPSRVDTDDLALNNAAVSDEIADTQPSLNAAVNNRVDPSPSEIDNRSTKPVIQRPTASKFIVARHIDNPLTRANRTFATAKKSAEIKTDFIALSFARNPESGQIVRVKVPSSMMVTLGLVATVEKPSSLVDAEVLIGDDGLTRAIRFIH